jgi:hypothetical protein
MVVAMKLQIILFRHLDKLIEVLGGHAPEVVLKESIPGKNNFIICLDVSNIPHPTLSVLPNDQYLFFGDDPQNSSIAIHKALISLKNFLEDTFAVEIHELSHSKIRTLELKIAHVVSSVKSFTNQFQSFMKDYQSSINLLAPIISSASQNCSSVIIGISKSLSDLCNVSQSSITRIEEQLLNLDREMTLYCCNGSSTTSNNSFKVLCTYMYF